MDIRKCFVLLLSLYLAACSSGGSDDADKFDSELSVENKTSSQAEETYDNLRNSTYTGNITKASISQESLAAFSSSLLFELMTPEYNESDGTVDGPISRTNLDRIDQFSEHSNQFVYSSNYSNINLMSTQSSQENNVVYEKIDEEFECSRGGRVIRKGTIYVSKSGGYPYGGIDTIYEECKDELSYFNGRAARYYHENNTSSAYYGGLFIEAGNKAFTVTGSVSYFSDRGLINVVIQRSDKNTSYQLIDWEIYPYKNVIEGKLYHSDHGYLELSSIEDYETNFESSFPVSGNVLFQGSTATNGSLLFYSNDEGLLSIDQDGDSQFDEMSFFNYYALVAGKLSGEFVAYEEPNYPPTYSYFRFDETDINTTDDINVILGSIEDPEQDSITINYVWKINGQVVANNNQSTLSSGLAKKNEIVTVIAEINDGHNVITTQELTLVIQDAPSSLSFSNLPSTHLSTEELSFNVDMKDPDAADAGNIDSSLSLTHGPAGMELSNGEVSWTPSNLLFGQSQVFHFGFSDSISNQTITGSIEVTDVNAKPLIARSGIETPSEEHSISIGQFDNDDSIEVLMTDSRNLIFTVELDGADVLQDWLYPFALSEDPIQQVISKDVNSDGIQDIFALTEHGVFHIADRTSLAKNIYENAEKSFKAMTFVDKSGGGYKIALLGSESLTFIDEEGTENKSIKISNPGETILAGNVDNDAATEIVLSGGYIYDGETYANEWFYPTGFGSYFSLINADNVGPKEIVGFSSSYSSSKLKLYSAVSKSTLWTKTPSPSLNVCSMNVGEISSSSTGDELVFSACDGSVKAYEISLTTASELWSTPYNYSYRDGKSVVVGNIDADSQNEILMGLGSNSSYNKGMIGVTDIDAGEPTLTYYSNQIHADSFSAAGIADVTPNQQKGIYMAPKSNGNSGHRIISMDFSGALSVSDSVGTNYDRARHAEVSDYDQDGYSEIFFGTSEGYNGSLKVAQLSDMNEEWSSGGTTYDDTIKTIVVADMNADTYEDAVYVNGRHVVISDVQNQVLVWESADFSYGIDDIAVGYILGKSRPDIVIASYETLSLWSFDSEDNSYSQEFTKSFDCERINVADLNGDGDVSIICLDTSTSYYSSNSKVIILDENLDEVKRFEVEGSVTEVIVENTTQSQKNLLVATSNGSGYSYNRLSSTISMISSENGSLIWSSPKLPGVIQDHNLYHYQNGDQASLSFASQDAMFIAR